MAEPVIDKALKLKKELETDTPPEFRAKVKGPMDEIMKIILGATQMPKDRKQ